MARTEWEVYRDEMIQVIKTAGEKERQKDKSQTRSKARRDEIE